MRSCFLVILLALPALAEHDQPRILERIAPEYTDEARLARLEGSALVSLVVAEDGSLRDVHVTQPIGLGLDEKAVDAVKHWQFAPAIEGERPVQTMTRVKVNFRLLIRREDWHLTRATFEAPDGASEPVIVSAPYPEPDKSPEPSMVKVSFDVDTEGVPRNITVSESSDEKSARDVTRFLAGWRFQPAMAAGGAVASRATLIFAAGAAEVSE
ncbi:MAG TPA: TonB family protein [Bryobacteraceae bacterium]|nr:TonB family protein [Bryobacteraceae bacterium]